MSFWDYAAAAPYVGIDMNAQSPIDAVFISPHKFIGGPGTPGVLVVKKSVLNNSVPAIVGGGTVYLTGNPDLPHSYSYSPDVAHGLAVLGEQQAALGRAWHLPAAAQLTTRELLERFAARAGTSIKIRRVPHWALRTVGVFSPLVSALAEMNYQWDVPYLADDGAFRRTFGVGPTDLDEAIDATLAEVMERQAEAA